MSLQLRNVSVVSGATMASRVLGLVRDMQVTAVFGVSALASAFVTAFTLPNLFRRLLGEGALTAALVPTLHEELARGGRPAAFVLVNQVASRLLLVTGALGAGGMALLATAPAWLPVVGVTAEAATLERWLLGAQLAVVLFPYLVCVCLAAALSAALQTLGRFLEPALSPVWLNLAMIGLLATGTQVAATPLAAMHWLCAGVLVGGLAQAVVPALALRREGWQPGWDARASDPVKAILRLMAPTVFSSAVYLVNLAISRLIGLSLNDGAAALLNLATRLMELPIGVFAVAVSTVVFPQISKCATAGDWGGLAQAYRRGLRLVLMINTPAAVGLAVLGGPIIRVLFQRGEFRAEDAAAMGPVLAAMAVGLPLLSFVNLTLRVFYAHKDTRTPVRAALLSFGVNVVLSFALMASLSTLGLALAGTLAAAVQTVYLQVKLRQKQAALSYAPLVADTGRIVVAALAMGALVAAISWGVAQAALPSWGRDGVTLALAIPLGAAGYFGVLRALRFEFGEELAALRAKLSRRRGGRKA